MLKYNFDRYIWIMILRKVQSIGVYLEILKCVKLFGRTSNKVYQFKVVVIILGEMIGKTLPPINYDFLKI